MHLLTHRRPSTATRLKDRAGGAPRPTGGAFTLLETMMALIVIGVGVLAFVDAQTAFVRSNNWSSHAGTGMLLANEIREMVRRLPRHDPVTDLFLASGGAGTVLVGWGRETGEVTPDDIDDIDDLDGLRFGLGGTFSGPIDANGNVIPGINPDGTIATDNDGNAIPLDGWVQAVYVEKVDVYDFQQVRPEAYEQPASAQLPAIAVNEFPMRVTVVVTYQGLNDLAPEEITRLTWIVPR